jgi:hypothetical protein
MFHDVAKYFTFVCLSALCVNAQSAEAIDFRQMQEDASKAMMIELNRAALDTANKYISVPLDAKEGACLDDLYSIDLSQLTSVGVGANDAIYSALMEQIRNLACNAANEHIQQRATELEGKIGDHRVFDFLAIIEANGFDWTSLIREAGLSHVQLESMLNKQLLSDPPVLGTIPDAVHVDYERPTSDIPAQSKPKQIKLEKAVDLQGLFKPKKDGD